MNNMSPTPPPAGKPRYRVLAIDDSPEILDTVRAALGDEFQVMATVDPRQGLQLAMHKQPDLILLDVVMPDLDGYQVCNMLKAADGSRNTPVIVVTGLGSQGDELQAFAAGAVDFVTKPIEPVILRARVRTHLELAAVRRALGRANDHMAMERELIGQIIVGMRNAADFYGARLEWASHSRDTAGGDVVLSARRPNGDEHVLVGDFTGHGLPAAIGTPLISHIFYSMTAQNDPLERILIEINDVLVRRLPVHLFMVSAAVCIPAGAEEVRIWSFGNPDLLHRDAHGAWSQLRSSELPMGIVLCDGGYASSTLSLQDGESLFLMTDGAFEAECKGGGMFGVQRIKDVLDRNDLSVHAVIDEILSSAVAVDDTDDMTLLRIDGGSRPSRGYQRE